MDAFCQSVLIRPCRVLWFDLLDYSAWHHLALTAIDSPLVNDRPSNRIDLIVACYVCTSLHVDGLTVEQFTEHPAKRFIILRSMLYDIETEGSKLRRHISEYMRIPKTWKQTTDSKASGTSFPFNIVSAVMRDYPQLSERACWNMPLSRLLAYRLAAAEFNGAVRLVTADEQRAIEDLKNAGN